MALPLQPKQATGVDLKDIAALLNVAGPLFGSGKQVSETSGDAGTNNSAQQLIASLMGGVDPAAMDGIINSIFQKGKAAFGPQLFQMAGSGAYNSTVQSQLAGEALARATAEASGAKLSATQDAQRTAAGLINGMQGANRRTVTKTGASPLGMIGGGITAALQAKSLLGKTLGKKGPLDLEEILKGTAGSAADDGTTAGIQQMIESLNGSNIPTGAGSLGMASDLPDASSILSMFGGGVDNIGSAGAMLDFGTAASALTDFGSLASDFGSASAMLDFGSTAADAGGFALDFGFPGAGTLLNAGLNVLQGKDPFQAIGNTLESFTGFLDNIFESIFG